MNSKRATVLPIELDWRFAVLQSMGRVRLKELMDFHKQGQKTFDAAMKAWEKEAKKLGSKYEDADSDHLLEQRGEIESLLDRSHTYGIVGLYTFLERFLNLAIERLRAGGAKIPPSRRGLSLHTMRDYLARSAKIDMNRTPFDWKALERLQEIRNCIVHTDGWITDDFVIRFAKVGMKEKEDTPLKLPANYFQDAWGLVNETYQAVYKQCDEKFGYARQDEVWLRPERKFTSAEVRMILKEAIDAGIVARERTTRKLLKRAKKAGSLQEDSCGRVWLTIDPKLLKHIHKLNISNVNTSYNTATIVDKFNLYLEDVEDCQRMWASSDGVKAAAAILKTHGINSHQESLAD